MGSAGIVSETLLSFTLNVFCNISTVVWGEIMLQGRRKYSSQSGLTNISDKKGMTHHGVCGLTALRMSA